MSPYLNILISTYNDRIFQLPNIILDYREDVNYIISHQYTEKKYKAIPKELIRNDIIISQIQGKGLTKSRNNAIKLANAKIGLISDDDVKYTNEYFNMIIKKFSSDDSIDVALFKIKTPNGCPEYKDYPKTPLHISTKPSFYVSSIEIAFKIETVKEKNISFDERFGAGQPLLVGGEESIFIFDCIKKGLNIWFFPEYIVEHPWESSIKSISLYDKKRVSINGACDARINGIKAIPKAFYYTFKFLPQLIKNKKNPLNYLKERLSASLYILKTNKKIFT